VNKKLKKKLLTELLTIFLAISERFDLRLERKKPANIAFAGF